MAKRPSEDPFIDLLEMYLEEPAPIRATIGEIGILTALLLLLPKVRRAGQLAKELQGQMSPTDHALDKGGSAAGSALTKADLLVENLIGSEVLLLLKNASFYAEERERDLVSSFIPDGQPYIVTLDPINGTRAYRHGQPDYEVIVTICDRDWRMLGALVYRPAQDDAFLGWRVQVPDTADRAYHLRFTGGGSTPIKPLVLKTKKAQRTVLIGSKYLPHAQEIRAAGYIPVCPSRSTGDTPKAKHATQSLLTGSCAGRLSRDQLIDSSAFGFLVACAGGIWEPGPFNPQTKMYERGFTATDSATADLLRSLLARHQAASG